MVSPPEIKNFKNLIESKINKTWNYVSHSMKFLTAPGENYGSIILQADVIFEEKNKNNLLRLVVKLCPPADVLREAFLTPITFKKEILAYLDLCPSIENFQIENILETTIRVDFFAKCYGARLNLKNKDDIDNNAAIVLENLKILGYEIEDRMKGFDLPTTKLILANLATFHAIVVGIRMKNPKLFEEKLLPCMEKVNIAGNMVDGFIDTAIKILETVKECKPHLDKVKKILISQKQIGGLQFPVESNTDFYTAVHTDFWTNNIMVLRNNQGEPINAKMIDLQLLDYGSGIRDVLFFLYSSVEINVCEEHFNNLVRFYYDTFIYRLESFKCDVAKLNWELFVKEINRVAPHELFHIIFMLKPVFSERGSFEDMAKINVNDFANISHVGETYVQKLKQVVLSYSNKRWIK